MAKLGNCFEAAARLISWGELMFDPSAKLVHGNPVYGGDDPGMAGKRMAHAWIEVDYEADSGHKLPMVIDRSNGNNVFMPALVYYKAGDIDRVERYSREEACRMLLEHEHFGPWADWMEDLV